MTTTYENAKQRLEEIRSSILSTSYDYFDAHAKLKEAHAVMEGLIYDKSISFPQYAHLERVELDIINKINKIGDDMIKENDRLLAIEQATENVRDRVVFEVTEETCPFRVKSYLQYDQSVIPNRCIILSPDEVKKVTEDEVDIQGGRAWVKNYIPRECNINEGCPLRMMKFKDIFKMFGYRSE